ncbi:hypothetical protein MSAN_00389000 [Mycena sanguinolenta]|uniref:Methyltransferase domain-containing protein n=1 Tax=Mycena sanguinolenta TaxID=230812 RepID=A0A8H6ZCM2_9AGAR|nr:hypothetical protein MSAN_00389000 [Mycena sanguinolenta]
MSHSKPENAQPEHAQAEHESQKPVSSLEQAKLEDEKKSDPEATKLPSSRTEPGDECCHYQPDPDELAFLKQQTRIQDEEELKVHVFAVQKKAYKVCPYPCIRRFGFVRIKIIKNPAAYNHVLELGRTLPGALFLDVGCCFGIDLRRLANDGFPVQNMLACDIRKGFVNPLRISDDFWDLGHELFRSTAESFPVAFLAGDVFDPAFLTLQAPATEAPQSPAPNLDSLASLEGLQGHLSAIHSASLFHLFGEVNQLQLARKLAGLLSARPGSIIFGCHGAQPTKGHVLGSRGKYMFCHSSETWREMWEGIFEQGSVEIATHMKNVGKLLNPTTDFYMLFWSVKRL